MYRFLRRPRLKARLATAGGNYVFRRAGHSAELKARPFCRVGCRWKQDGIPAHRGPFSRGSDTLRSFSGSSFCYRIVTTAASQARANPL
jgi:hypothetical protein